MLADKLMMNGLVGPITSVKHPIGLFVAYLLDVPWFGRRGDVHDTEEILASGAALIILPRDTDMAKQLREDVRLTNADKWLFGCDKARGALPFEVYLTRPRSTHDTCPEDGVGIENSVR
jgi:hypothetical protein